jgi:hypothetical protein
VFPLNLDNLRKNLAVPMAGVPCLSNLTAMLLLNDPMILTSL